jgi:serine kinase of HPr protein (carbohydrate metabolism regulator)
MIKNIHATCINLNSKGVLILGDSGSGKSDLALRLITMFSAKLVGDDRINIENNNGKIKASSPDVLKGLLEVRGVGIIKINYQEETKVDLVVKLTSEKIERLPDKNEYEIEGCVLPLFYLNPFEFSAPSKVVAMLSLL